MIGLDHADHAVKILDHRWNAMALSCLVYGMIVV